mgnify:CR=1 FL=1
MSYTKRQFVIAAFEEIGLASYTFDITDDELSSACRRLDAMMAEWNHNPSRSRSVSKWCFVEANQGDLISLP